MNIEYRRTVQGSYMVIEGKNNHVGYEKQMLKQNDVPQLLSFHTMELNGKTQFWYDIGGMRAFKDIILSEGITKEKLYELFSSVKDSYERLSRFLIGEEHILLHPDALFYEKKGGIIKARLCFCPMEHDDIKEQLAELMRFVISAVDHTKSDITALCYELYSITERDVFSFCDLMERLESEFDGCLFAEDNPFEQKVSVLSEDLVISPYEMPDSVEKIECNEEATDTEKHSLFDKLKSFIYSLLPDLLKGRQRLMPEKKPFRDIEFDPVKKPETQTVLLSADMTGCRGRLIYESGGRGGCDLLVDKNPFSIGSRDGGNDAILSSEAVSRYHAKIFRRDGAFYIQDLNSKNGTFLNGEILPYNKPRKLNRMDMISFADVVYRMV